MSALLNQILNNSLLVPLAGALGGLLGLLVSYQAIGKIFRMLRTSTGEIGSLPAGEQAEIVGKADGETVLQSPITRKACVFWQVVIMERRSTGKSSHWVTIYSKASNSPFDVYDGTGRMRVYPGRFTELLLQDDVSKSSGVFSSLDEQTQSALSSFGVETKGFLNLNRPLRVQERYIEQGDQIYLSGTTSSNNTGAKVMDGNDLSLIVSDRSELSLLSRFIGQVILNAVLGVIIGVILGLYFVS